MEPTLGLAEWLAARGYNAIPHLSARLVRDRAHLTDLLAHVSDVGLRRIFVIGGDGLRALKEKQTHWRSLR